MRTRWTLCGTRRRQPGSTGCPTNFLWRRLHHRFPATDSGRSLTLHRTGTNCKARGAPRILIALRAGSREMRVRRCWTEYRYARLSARRLQRRELGLGGWKRDVDENGANRVQVRRVIHTSNPVGRYVRTKFTSARQDAAAVDHGRGAVDRSGRRRDSGLDSAAVCAGDSDAGSGDGVNSASASASSSSPPRHRRRREWRRSRQFASSIRPCWLRRPKFQKRSRRRTSRWKLRLQFHQSVE